MFRRILLALGVLSLLTASSLANAPPPVRPIPEPTPPPNPMAVATKATVPVKIEHADLTKEGKGVAAKLAIPRKVLARVAPGMPAAGQEKQSSLPSLGTLVAGIAMSIGAIGLVLAARGSRSGRAVAAAALLVAMFAGGYVFASKKEPQRERAVTAPAESVVVEIVDGGDVVVITLSGK